MAASAADCLNLLECFQRLPDPRDPRGLRHALASLLAGAAAAVLAGARSFTAIGEWIADAPAQVMTALGVRRDPLSRAWQPPDESTVRRPGSRLECGMTGWPQRTQSAA
ncbi:transposase family protein [Nonomuraea sp. H19]|uniref:transposase family protein n=1 Tax=Nonomuraea sp. H19 TaxID=3452206 RepID=UPI003F8BDC30